jgi:hypothetical protein
MLLGRRDEEPPRRLRQHGLVELPSPELTCCV